MIWGALADSFLSSDGLNSVIFWSLFPLKARFSHRRYCKIHVFAKSFFDDSRVDFSCFLEALGVVFLTFSDFFCLGNRLEN